MQNNFRKAELNDRSNIWVILQQAIERRKQDGSTQWQDGYPNPNTVKEDIKKGWGYVLETDGEMAAYAAVIFDGEPVYDGIKGKWLSQGPYVTVHRVAVSDKFAGKGVATQIFLEIEEIATSNEVFSIKVDTNFDNAAMLKILEKMNYTYCGEVYFRGSARKAFEKLLPSPVIKH